MVAEPRRTGDPGLPRRIGRYEAFLQIGVGGMARVHLAVQRGLSGQKAELVVVKILRPEVVDDEHILELFTDEARIAMRLEHPNVIRTREVIAEPPDYLLAMDFHNGQSLLDVVSRLGRPAVPLDEHVYVLNEVLAGLSYAHELEDDDGRPFGIVHRDVSPANVLVTYTGEVKLLDFGIAKATGALAATRDGVVKGKLGYAAPEQCLGQPADPRSDIYSVGVMLWEAIAGRRRASGETWQSVLQARLEDAEPKLEEVCPDAPEALAAIVRKALARDPNDRYSTAREFRNDLGTYLAEKRTVIGPSRIAAMLKPHFDRDRADRHRCIEAFLKSLKSGKNVQVRRIPLPGGGAASPAPAVPAPRAAAPVAEEEHTAPIPVDAALLQLSRGEPATADQSASRRTAPASRSPAPRPFAERAPTTPIPESPATTAPSTGDTAATTAPPPPDFEPTSAARPSVKPVSGGPERPREPDAATASVAASATPVAIKPNPAPALLPAPPKSAPLATDAYGLVTVSKPVPPPYGEAGAAFAAVPKKKPRAWIIVAAAALAIGLGAVILSVRNGSKESTVAAPAPTTSAAHPGSAAPPPDAPKIETVNVRISVDPPDAVVKLDGNVLSDNPFVGPLPKDTATRDHELTVFAEGCRDVRQIVHLNRDIALLVAMKCVKQGARSATRSTAARSARVLAAPPPSETTAEPRPAAAAPAAPAAPTAQPTQEPQAAPAEPPPKSGAAGEYHIRSEL